MVGLVMLDDLDLGSTPDPQKHVAVEDEFVLSAFVSTDVANICSFLVNCCV